MGSIERLDSGRYRAYAWNAAAKKTTDKKVPVKPADGSRSFASWEEADAAVKAREAELDGTYLAAGIPVQRQRRREKVGFSEYAWRWYEESGGELNTRDNRATHIRALIKTFGQFQDINDIVDRDVRTWWVKEERDYAPTTRSCHLATFNKLMTAAVQDHLREDNPVKVLQEQVGDLTQRVHQVRYLDDQELFLSLYYLPRGMWPAALLAYDCGLRAAECAGLRWMRIDLDKLSITVKDVMEKDGTLRPYPKGKKVKTIPLTERAAEALRVHKEATGGSDEDFVFWTSRGRPASAAYIGRTWMELRREAGFTGAEHATFHMLRHGCGNNLAVSGAPARVIQAILRHADLNTSQTYIDEVNVDEARDWMERRLKPGKARNKKVGKKKSGHKAA